MRNDINYSPKFIERQFWPKIKKGNMDECWEWTACTYKFGYGHTAYKGKHLAAHRVSWELANGTIPTDKIIMHRCDNPKCCNPAHLQLGTYSDNTKDMYAKNRQYMGDKRANGAKGSRCKLMANQVKEILISDLKSQELADIYNVTRGAINFIRNGTNWKHLSRSI